MSAIPDPAELQSVTADIYYEALMLYRVYTNYWKNEIYGKPKLVLWQHNCVVESTMLHTRILLDFFEKSRKKSFSDDVLAEDYGFPRTSFTLPANLRQRINTSIAHLSYARARVLQGERDWMFRDYIPSILLKTAEFFRHLIDAAHPLSPDLPRGKLEEFINWTKQGML